MELEDFKEALENSNFEQTIIAIRSALDDYSNGINIDDFEDILLNSLEDNPKLDWLIDTFGNPFQDGDDSIYVDNQSMIDAFEDMNYLELSEQQEIFIDKLKNEDFFDISAANSVIACQPQINLIKPEVYMSLNNDDCKAILNVLDSKQNMFYVVENLDLAVLGMVKTSELGNYDEKSNVNLFKSAALFLNLNSFGLKFDEAYNALIENSVEDNTINSKIIDKIYNKVTDPENLVKPKFSLTALETKNSDIDNYYDLDDLDDKVSVKKKNKMKM